MNWGVWIVPVIALAVWILLQMRAPDGPAAQNRQRPQDGDRPRRPTGDVGLFLEEIERLRRQSAPPKPTPPPTTPAPPLRESAPAREDAPLRETAPTRGPAPVSPTTAADFERPAPPPAPRRRVEKPTKVRPPRVVPVAVLPILEVLPAEAPRPVPATAAEAPAVASLKSRPASPAVAQLRALLQTPGSLQTAVLLQEVLGAPRCRRSR